MAPNPMMSFLRRRNPTNMADVDLPKKKHARPGDVGLAMTGNTALLGLALGQGDLIEASRPSIGISAGFLAGAAVASASVEPPALASNT